RVSTKENHIDGERGCMTILSSTRSTPSSPRCRVSGKTLTLAEVSERSKKIKTLIIIIEKSPFLPFRPVYIRPYARAGARPRAQHADFPIGPSQEPGKPDETDSALIINNNLRPVLPRQKTTSTSRALSARAPRGIPRLQRTNE